MLIIFNQVSIVLFDFGATHSFVSEKFSAKLPIEILYFAPTLCVKMPSGDSLVANRKCCVNVNIHDRQLFT